MSENKLVFERLNPFEMTIHYVDDQVESIYRQLGHHVHSECEIYVHLGGDVSFMVEDQVYPIQYGNLVITIAGIFAGAFSLNLIDRLVPHMHNLMGSDSESHHGNANLDKVLLFVSAIAIHNLPEGIAAGVSFGSGNTAEAIMIAGGIALQNIPEGMVIIGPMLAAGISPRKTLICALATGLVEVVGTLLGYFAVTVATAILPFALAFAGGTMLYVISDEMIPETHHDNESGATYALLVGFCLMLVSDVLLG